ncbi:IS3 family transposase [Vibrio breoganii]|uniref:IS3 family transposase n=1 Tax=Vibrio breoganii TaxID=553239 RepID=UPI003BB16036
MKLYPEDHKKAMVQKLIESGLSLSEFARQERISVSTLYGWKKKYSATGLRVSKGHSSNGWSAEQKFAVVLETAALSEVELSKYCREKGLYPEQVKQWKLSCIAGNEKTTQTPKLLAQERKEDRKRIKELEKELKRKDAALAETAALLELRKKLNGLLGGRRGALTTFPDRRYYIKLIDEAVASGARKKQACQEIGLSLRTLQRWMNDGELSADRRPLADRPEPANKLAEDERQQILIVCNEGEFADLPPSQIVPRLADDGIYLASESTFYRVLKENNQLTHRGKDKPKGTLKKPTSHKATGPNQVWSWDITYCPTTVIGQHYYLYMIEDIFSRKIVGWEVHECESGEHAANLLERTVWSEKCVGQSVVLHSDNGSPMKSLTMLAKMQELGVAGSRSRPRVSNDNPYSESLFRTVKYCRRWPSEGFKSLEEVRQWTMEFVRWYNTEHRHSRINFVTPEQKHEGQDTALLKQRDEVYKLAQLNKPERWSKETRNWSPVTEVELNPENEKQAA